MDTQVDSLMSFLSNFEQRKQQVTDEVVGLVRAADYWKRGDYDSFDTDSVWLSQVDNTLIFLENATRNGYLR